MLSKIKEEVTRKSCGRLSARHSRYRTRPDRMDVKNCVGSKWYSTFQFCASCFNRNAVLILDSHRILASTKLSLQYATLRYFQFRTGTANIGKPKLPKTITTRQSSGSPCPPSLHMHAFWMENVAQAVSIRDGRITYKSQVAVWPSISGGPKNWTNWWSDFNPWYFINPWSKMNKTLGHLNQVTVVSIYAI